MEKFKNYYILKKEYFFRVESHLIYERRNFINIQHLKVS